MVSLLQVTLPQQNFAAWKFWETVVGIENCEIKMVFGTNRDIKNMETLCSAKFSLTFLYL